MLGIVAIVAGLVLFVLRRPFSEKNVAFQRAILRVHWGEREVRLGEAGAVIAAVLCIAWGIVALTVLVPLAS